MGKRVVFLVAVLTIGLVVPTPAGAATEIDVPAPFTTWAQVVDRLHLDLTGVAPSAAARTEAVRRLSTGTATPGSYVAGLRTSRDHTTVVDPATRLYRAVFLRIPDQGGLTYWIGKRRTGGWTLVRMAEQFARSSEFTNRYGQRANRPFVELIYGNVLERTPDRAGVDYWTRQLDLGRRSRGEIMVGFSESSEYRTRQAAAVHVAVLTTLLLGRAPTTAEADDAIATLGAGGTVAALADRLVASADYGRRVAGRATATVATALAEAPAPDTAAVAAFTATEQGDALADAADAAEPAALPAASCTDALAAVQGVLTDGFLSGAGAVPDPVLAEAHLSLYAGAARIASSCRDRSTPGAEGTELVRRSLLLIDGRGEVAADAAPTAGPPAPAPAPAPDAPDASEDERPPTAGDAAGATAWWAFGDSYASGEGIPASDPTSIGKGNTGQRCERATGRNGAGRAWSTEAYAQLFGITTAPFLLTACTGTITDDWTWQRDQAVARATTGRPDVISLNFGGNNVGFGPVLKNCIDVSLWATIASGPGAGALAEWKAGAERRPDLTPGCNHSRAELVARVQALLTGTPHLGTRNVRTLLGQLAATAQVGGHVIVAGYPMLFEDPANWASVNAYTGMCQGVHASDARTIRSVQAALNTGLRNEVAAANVAHPSVTFHYLDAAATYETTSARHGLCSRNGDQWINGLTTSATSGDFRPDRSFHPNQAGHTALGRALAAQLRAAVGTTGLQALWLGNNQLADAVIGRSYRAPLLAHGGSGARTWTATGLPPGLAISGSAIVGTPTATGSWSVTLRVRDAKGRTLSTTATLRVNSTVAASPWTQLSSGGSGRVIDISGDGRYVAFQAQARDPVPNPTSEGSYEEIDALYRWDRQTGATTRIGPKLQPMRGLSLTSDGGVALLADGTTIGDGVARTDVAVWHPDRGIRRLTSGLPAVESISARGNAAFLRSACVDDVCQMRRIDLTTGAVGTAFSVSRYGPRSSSADGRFGLFTRADSVVALWDFTAGTVTPVDQDALGFGLGSVDVLSANGRYLAGLAEAPGGKYQVRVVDRTTGQGWSTGEGFDIIWNLPSVSDDGQRVAYVGVDVPDVLDEAVGPFAQVTGRTSGTTVLGPATGNTPTLSADGRHLAIVSPWVWNGSLGSVQVYVASLVG